VGELNEKIDELRGYVDAFLDDGEINQKIREAIDQDTVRRLEEARRHPPEIIPGPPIEVTRPLTEAEIAMVARRAVDEVYSRDPALRPDPSPVEDTTPAVPVDRVKGVATSFRTWVATTSTAISAWLLQQGVDTDATEILGLPLNVVIAGGVAALGAVLIASDTFRPIGK